MQHMLLMQHFYSVYQLVPYLQHRFYRQLLTQIIEQVLQTLTQQVHQHHVVLALSCKCVHLTTSMNTLGKPVTEPKEERYLYILAS